MSTYSGAGAACFLLFALDGSRRVAFMAAFFRFKYARRRLRFTPTRCCCPTVCPIGAKLTLRKWIGRAAMRKIGGDKYKSRIAFSS
jgi:hypothetical protein